MIFVYLFNRYFILFLVLNPLSGGNKIPIIAPVLVPAASASHSTDLFFHNIYFTLLKLERIIKFYTA